MPANVRRRRCSRRGTGPVPGDVRLGDVREREHMRRVGDSCETIVFACRYGIRRTVAYAGTKGP